MGFRVREVSSTFTVPFVDDPKDRDSCLYNVGLLTLPVNSTSLWRDFLLRADLAHHLAKAGSVCSDSTLITMAENIAPKCHVARGLVALAKLESNGTASITSTSSCRKALGEITKTVSEALAAASSHLGPHHPIKLMILEKEFELLQGLMSRIKVGVTAKGNPLMEILRECLECRQNGLDTSVRVLGRAHPMTKQLLMSIGDLHKRNEDMDAAIASYQDALKVLSNRAPFTDKVKILISVAECYRSKGQAEIALEQASSAKAILDARQKEGKISTEESDLFEPCLKLIAQLSLEIVNNGDANLKLFDETVMSEEMNNLVALGASCYEQLYERLRAHPDQLEGEQVVDYLRRIISLKLQLAKPAQKTLVKAVSRMAVQPSDQSRAKDLILRMVTSSSASSFCDRILINAEADPSSNGMDELKLLVIIASSK